MAISVFSLSGSSGLQSSIAFCLSVSISPSSTQLSPSLSMLAMLLLRVMGYLGIFTTAPVIFMCMVSSANSMASLIALAALRTFCTLPLAIPWDGVSP